MAIQVVNPILRAQALTAWPLVAVARVAKAAAVAVMAVETVVVAVVAVVAAHSAAEERQRLWQEIGTLYQSLLTGPPLNGPDRSGVIHPP